jgi:drug/metabolite transporter (DMT)-like permease
MLSLPRLPRLLSTLPHAERLPRAQLISWAVAIGFVLCWSSGFVGSRMAVDVAGPVVGFYAWRFALAALLAWAVVISRRAQPGHWPDRHQVAHEMLTGSLTVGIYLLTMLLAVAEGVSASVAALIGALQPLAAALLASRLLRERSCMAQWWGMGLATLGAAAMVVGDMQGVGGAPVWAYALPLLAVMAVSLGSVLTPPGSRSQGARAPARRMPEPLSLVTRLALQLSAAAGLFLVAALILEPGLPAPPPASSNAWLALGWLIALSTFGGYGFFVASLGRFGVTWTSGLIALTPAMTLGMNAVLFGERPDALGLAGLVLSLFGALWALAAGSKRRRRAAVSGISQRGGRSGPRPRGRASRPGSRTWSGDETQAAAHTAPSRPPRY